MRHRGLAAAALLASLAIGARAHAAPGPSRGDDERGFGGDPTHPHYPPPRSYDLRNIRLAITIEPEKRRLSARIEETLAPLRDGFTSVHLDAVELDVHAARLVGPRGGEAALPISASADGLELALPRPYRAGEPLTVAVEYETAPRSGMYFTRWPGQPAVAFTQGEQESNRWWMPVWDEPDDKATSEILVTCPADLTAVSNGALVSVAAGPRPGFHTFDWVERVPHSTYLNSIVVGKLAKIEDHWGEVPVLYYVEPGREDDARRTYGRTPEMMQLFGLLTGRPYPYEKYGQTTVPDFPFGGMENVSATTLSDYELVTPAVAGSTDEDAVVAHELAHQWFGDLLTTVDWPNVWLNEGFATFFEMLWEEKGRSEDEYAAARATAMKWYLSEEAGEYSRPVVDRVYRSNDKLFDAHTYAKGALVLHMLRAYLGDERFFAGLRAYVAAFAEKNVDTHDFVRAMSDASDEDLTWFFDQWIFRPGHPKLGVDWTYDPALREVKLDVTQTATAGDPATQPPYLLPTTVEVWQDAQHALSFPVRLAKRDEELIFAAPQRPQAVVLDPRRDLLAEQAAHRPVAEDAFLLLHHPQPLTRVASARALGESGASAEAVSALGTCLARDRFHGAREECAAALGEARGAVALESLLAARRDADAHVRLAVAKALGEFRADVDPRAAQALAEMGKQDADDRVRGAALEALGATRAPEAFAVLRGALDARGTWNDVVPVSALAGLAALEDPRAVPLALARADASSSNAVRKAAVTTLGELDALLDRPSDDVREALRRDSEAPVIRLRQAAIEALGATGDPEAMPLLADAAARDPEESVRLDAEDAEQALRDQEAGRGPPVAAVRELTELREDQRRLRERLDALEAKQRAAAPQPRAR